MLLLILVPHLLLLFLHRLDESFYNSHKLFVFLIYDMYIVNDKTRMTTESTLIGLNMVFTKLRSLLAMLLKKETFLKQTDSIILFTWPPICEI